MVQKYAAMRLNTATITFVAALSASVIVIAATFRNLQWQSWSGVAAAAMGGLIGGIATIALYGALRQAPASVVIPLSSLGVVITVILSYIFLGETLGVKQLFGVILGILSIILLVSGD